MRICLLLLSLWFALPAFAQQQMLPCDAGIERCAPLKKDIPKYARCVALMCLKTEPQKEQEISYDTCVKGAYKCAPLVDKPDEYWGCMRFECSAPDAQTLKRDCQEGKNACGYIVKNYYECTTRVCENRKWNLYEVCSEGQTECAPILENFWSCSQRVCLGDLKFTYKSPKDITREQEKIIIPYLLHAYKQFDENEDPAYRMMSPGGGPSRLLECPAGRYIMCHSNNWYSCRCSDGSTPTSATPKLIRKYQQTGVLPN